MLLERKNVTKGKPSLFILFLLFFGSVLLIALMIHYFDLGQPIYEPLFGHYVQWPHMIGLGLVSLIIYLSAKSKLPFYTDPSTVYRQEERALFQQRYFTLIEDERKNLRMNLSVYVYMFIGILPMIILNWLWTSENIAIPFMIGMTLFIIISFYSIFKSVSYSQKRGEELIKRINNLIKNTHLKLKNQFAAVAAGLSLEGTFKGRKVDVVGFASGGVRGIKIKSSIRVAMALKSSHEFGLGEKHPKWKQIKSDQLNDYLRERFHLNGITLSRLPDCFKKKISNYPRNLFLAVKKDQLVYHSKDINVYPFYSMEGLILFLDELNEMAEALERTNVDRFSESSKQKSLFQF